MVKSNWDKKEISQKTKHHWTHKIPLSHNFINLENMKIFHHEGESSGPCIVPKKKLSIYQLLAVGLKETPNSKKKREKKFFFSLSLYIPQEFHKIEANRTNKLLFSVLSFALVRCSLIQSGVDRQGTNLLERLWILKKSISVWRYYI